MKMNKKFMWVIPLLLLISVVFVVIKIMPIQKFSLEDKYYGSSEFIEIETSDLDTTFDDILSSQTTNKYSYEATTMPVTITIPETRTIIDDEVTVQIGDNGREITYTLRQLSGNGVNGLTYTEGVGFTWVINSDDILDENLYISYKVEGVAEDNQ